MAWPLSSWLMLTRVFQLLGALAAAGLNGFLAAWVYSKHLGLVQAIVALELLICILLVYTTVAVIVQHTGRRAKRRGWLMFFIVMDLIFCAVDLAIITILSRAGLPDHCYGLTRNDSQFKLDDGLFTTPGFSDESGGRNGRLDKYCGHERSFYVIALVLVFTYVATVVLGSLSIYDTNHVKNAKVDELLESLDRAKDHNIQLKLLDSDSSAPARESSPRVSAPASEGIITRTSSLRSTLTSLTSSSTGHRFSIPRRPIPHQPTPALPPQAPSHSRPSSTPPGAGMGIAMGFTPVPLDEESAEAALVADGMQHQPHRSHRRGASSSAQQGVPMPMLLEEEAVAESALVSDGMRPFGSALPPYEPGSSRMAGHSAEDNDMRLSDYVKGETQAQDMKDSGRY